MIVDHGHDYSQQLISWNVQISCLLQDDAFSPRESNRPDDTALKFQQQHSPKHARGRTSAHNHGAARQQQHGKRTSLSTKSEL